MSWKQSGGIKQFDANKSFNVNSISTDSFTMRESYKGAFKILGEFFVSRDCSLNGNVDIGGNAVVGKDLSVKNTLSIGDISLNTNTITTSPYGLLGLGINVRNPVALLDISGNSPKIMNTYSSLANVNSTLLRNVHNNQTNIVLDNSAASLSFVMGGNAISMHYDLSADLISFNRDLSFVGTVFVGKSANIFGNMQVQKNTTIGGNLTVSEDIGTKGNLSVRNNLTILGSALIAGDLSMNGSVTFGELVLKKGLTVENDTKQNGNLILGNNFGVFFEDINRTDAVIRKYNIITDPGLKVSNGSELYLNSDVVIGGNLYIDGSTNFLGSGGGGVATNGRLLDLSGTDQTRFFVNFFVNELSDNDLKGAGFYIYNNNKFEIGNGSLIDSIYNHGFVKISDVCSNKLSIRTVGSPNVVSLDLSKLKNKAKNGLLVLKHETDTETDYNDNYNIVSSHSNISTIDVSNSFTGVKNIFVENVVACDRDVIVGNSIYIKKNMIASYGTIDDITIGNIILQKNMTLSEGVVFKGNVSAGNILLNNLYLNKDIYLSDDSVIRGNIIGNDLSMNRNVNVGGNIRTGNLILNKDIYLSTNSVIHGNLGGTFYLGNIDANEIKVNSNLIVTKNVTIDGTYKGNSIVLNFGEASEVDDRKFVGYVDVVTAILEVQSYTLGDSIKGGVKNTFTKENTFEANTTFNGDALFGNIYINANIFATDASIKGNMVASGNTFLYNKTYVSGTMNVSGTTIFNDLLRVAKDVSIYGGNLIVSNTSVLTDVSINNNLIIGNSLTLYGDFLTTEKGNCFINNNAFFKGNLDVLRTTFLNQTYTRGNVDMYGNLQLYNGSATFGNTVYIAKDLSLGSNLYVTKTANVNDLYIKNNLTLYGDFQTNNGNLYVNNNAFIYGNLDITGDTFLNQTYIRGNVDMYGNVRLNTVSIAKDLSLGSYLYVTKAAYVNEFIGNNLTVYGNTAIYGNATLEGLNTKILNNCTFYGNVNMNHDLYIVDKNLHILGGDIDLSRGNLSFVYDGSFSKITPERLNYLKNVTSDIQTQIDDIKEGSDVNRNTENEFTKNNTFTANVYAKSLTAGVCTITNSLIVQGTETIIGLTEIDGDYVGKRTYYKINESGSIETNHNINCEGEKIYKFRFSDNSPLILEDGSTSTRLSGTSFFNKYTYSESDRVLYKISDRSVVPSAAYEVTQHTQGGMISCLDLSLSRNFYMHGDMFMNGGFHVNGSTFTSAELESALTNGSSGGSIVGAVQDAVTFANTVTFNKSVLLKGNVSLSNNNSLELVSGNILMTSGSLHLTSGSIKLISGSVTASTFLSTSDYRLKYDVQTISGSYYTVDNLRPVSYNFKTTMEPHLGFIAHELQEHFPSAVNGEKDGSEMQSVNYSEIIPILVKEIQELKKEVRLLRRGA